MRHALRLLYEAFLPRYAPETSHGGQASIQVQQAPARFRNQVIPGDARAFQGMEGKMAESAPEEGGELPEDHVRSTCLFCRGLRFTRTEKLRNSTRVDFELTY